MSHGGGDSGGVAEPNLTPLLDVVLQLLMFFMMCVNFVSEQVNEDIRLPRSQAVKPMDKADTDVLFINLKPFALRDFQDRLPADVLARVAERFRDGDECVLIPGKEPMRRSDLNVWLKQQYADAKQIAESRGAKDVGTAVVIRAHKDADYAQVFEVLQMCKNVGYTRLRLRADQERSGRYVMTTRRKPDAGPEPNLPVTPMLDMAFQLLAFFVMTYHPSDLEGQMELSLPSENITQAKNKEDVKADAAPDKQKPIDLPSNLTVIVRTQMDNVNNGRISALTLQDDAGPQPIDNLEKLAAELKKRQATVENKENIKIQADGKLKWESVIEVMDVCQQAGFKNISFVPPPDFHMSGQ